MTIYTRTGAHTHIHISTMTKHPSLPSLCLYNEEAEKDQVGLDSLVHWRRGVLQMMLLHAG